MEEYVNERLPIGECLGYNSCYLIFNNTMQILTTRAKLNKTSRKLN